MTRGSLLLAFTLVVLLPGTGIVAGILGWYAFRPPVPRWRMVAVAVATLAVPYVLVAVIEPRGGVDLAFSANPLAAISPLVALGIGIATIRRWQDIS